MSGILLASSIVGGAQDFAPTVSGRLAASGIVVFGYGEGYAAAGSASGDGDAGIWLLSSASDCFIRVGALASGNLVVDEAWYNGAGVDQGDPGVISGAGTTVFQLNARPDSVNIYTSEQSTITGSPTFPAIGTWTDDDKSTFFNPTDSVKYGREVNTAVNQVGTGISDEDGTFTLQFTFRKAGYNDYTVLFKGQGNAHAEVD